MIAEPESAINDLVEAVLSAPMPASALDRKILEHFPGLVVRKDLTNGLKQNAVVPTYVLEYLLGQHCATDDPEALKAGLESVQRILARHHVHRNQAELIKSTIKEKGRHKVIDKLTVELNDRSGNYEAEFSNLGLKKVPVADDFVRRHPKLLVGGIWCIAELTYELPDDPRASPWRIDSLKPIQVSHTDHEEFIAARAYFSTEEWMGLLMQSIGFNPDLFSWRGMLLQLIRLVPYCERNYNLLELGPKGTGKSHVYAEFSPHGILISGSEVTTAKLFVNNSTGRIGLVGYWDCICFDEFAGKDKKVNKALVDIMKNFMANRSFSRGIEQLTAEASMVFMGNTQVGSLHAQARPLLRALAGQVHRLGVPRPTARLLVSKGDEVEVLLITQSDGESCVKQAENLNQIVEAFAGSRVAFTWKLDHNPNFHARSITTDTGWKITLDRGLDIFQRYDSGPFSLAQAMQEARLTRGTEVSYLKIG